MTHFHINRRAEKRWPDADGRPEALATWFTADAAAGDLFRRVTAYVEGGWHVRAADTMMTTPGRAAGTCVVALTDPTGVGPDLTLSMWACVCSTGEQADDLRPDEDDPECEGHESLDGAHMGETVFCDGSCVRRR